MVNRGDRVTFIWPGAAPTLSRGFVVSNALRASRPPLAHLAFKLRDVPFDKIRLYAKPDDESVTWVRGWLRRWWPPDRERARALQVAYALSGARIAMKARTTVVAGHIGFALDDVVLGLTE